MTLYWFKLFQNELNLLTLTHWPVVRHRVHAERQLLLRVLVELLPHRKRLGDHLALLDPLGLVVAAADNPDTRGGGG